MTTDTNSDMTIKKENFNNLLESFLSIQDETNNVHRTCIKNILQSTFECINLPFPYTKKENTKYFDSVYSTSVSFDKNTNGGTNHVVVYSNETYSFDEWSDVLSDMKTINPVCMDCNFINSQINAFYKKNKINIESKVHIYEDSCRGSYRKYHFTTECRFYRRYY